MSAIQYAKELMNAALQKGEQALSQFQAVAPTLTMRSVSSSIGNLEGKSTTTSPVAASVQARMERFRQELNASYINVHAVKRLAMTGIPDRDGLRAIVWKVLLGYLPPSPSEWPTLLARRRTQYHVFCEELIVDPTRPMQQDVDLHAAPDDSADPLSPRMQSSSQSPEPAVVMSASATPPASQAPLTQSVDPLLESATVLEPEDKPSSARSSSNTNTNHHVSSSSCNAQSGACDDHPLSLDAGSRWRTFFQDNEILEQITRDVMRTHPDMHFFTGETEEAELHRQLWQPLIAMFPGLVVALDKAAAVLHRKEMRRALFMYAKLNPGLRYIQGMNELIAPLYYLFKHDKDHRERQFAEADAFWCFLELISEFRDHFCAQLDNAQTGIRATIRKLMVLLQHCDQELWHHIEVVNKVDPQYYAFRWITLLLSQEFAFPDTLRIWDTILSDPNGKMDCLLRICVAMVLNVKPKLMQGDFTVIMKTLQRYPPVDVNVLLQKAAELPTCNEVII